LSDAAAVHADPHGHGHHPNLQHHFESLDQQHEAATLGMWLFLVTEVMFFGGLLMAYLLYRVWYPLGWAEGSNELDIVLGGTNTAVLIASSLTMALGVRAAQTGAHPRVTVGWLILTIAFGLTFLVIKFFEYKHKFEIHHVPGYDWVVTGPHANEMFLFVSLYFSLTGLHALHMIIGVVLMSVITWMAYKRRFTPQWYTPVEMAGLYWHFVDIVWIFLFPLLYLVDRSHHLG
jgi:cytochrome c oxidase subunit III